MGAIGENMTTLILYFLGVFMHYKLSIKIREFDGYYDSRVIILIASLFWPISSMYYFLKAIKERTQDVYRKRKTGNY